MKKITTMVLIMAIFVAGCSAPLTSEWAKNIEATYIPLPSVAIPPPSSAFAELLLFGGPNHDVFLGCMNCSSYDTGSVCNSYGEYGSSYRINSIWNTYSTFGNSYNLSSPWNAYSVDISVPVIVDRNGNFYGYFTINSYRSDAFREAGQLRELFNSHANLDNFRDTFCD